MRIYNSVMENKTEQSVLFYFVQKVLKFQIFLFPAIRARSPLHAKELGCLRGRDSVKICPWQISSIEKRGYDSINKFTVLDLNALTVLNCGKV